VGSRANRLNPRAREAAPEIHKLLLDSQGLDGGPIELRIYRGADGQFKLYDDAGDSYDYEKGQHSVISLRWNDSAALLTIGTREGSYPGMVETRAFRIVLVGSAHGTGVEVTGKADKEITYDGKETNVSLRNREQ
jgi:alpha-D-xyloside xylohydrolase